MPDTDADAVAAGRGAGSKAWKSSSARSVTSMADGATGRATPQSQSPLTGKKNKKSSNDELNALKLKLLYYKLTLG